MTRTTAWKSEILRKSHDDMISLCKRMKPEERLLAHYRLSQLIYQIYQAGVRYRKKIGLGRRSSA